MKPSALFIVCLYLVKIYFCAINGVELDEEFRINNLREKIRVLSKFLDIKDNDLEMNSNMKNYLSVKNKFWTQGIKGKKVKLGIFDSGVSNMTNICNIQKIENFSNETIEDLSGHGTYITSLICHPDLGLAPDIEIYSYKVFNKNKMTFTSWLLRALDMALLDKVDMINLSFGGINLNDILLINKLEKLIQSKVIIVSSAGNDGPSFGTINFPGNLPYVGALTDDIFKISSKSSRGPAIYGKNILINKPNTWAPGENATGLDQLGRKIISSGSSAATAIVTGFLALILSYFYNERQFFNSGNLILLIKESNIHNPYINFGEIGSGIFNVEGLFKLTNYYINNKSQLKSQIYNDMIDFSLDSYSNFTISQESKKTQLTNFYSTMQPVYFSLTFIKPENSNLTIINKYFEIFNISPNSPDVLSCILLEVVDQKNVNNQYIYFQNYFGILQMKIKIIDEIKCHFYKEKIEWEIIFTDIENDSKYAFKLNFDIVTTPNKLSRLLYTNYLNLYYPFDGYVPKDNLYDKWYNYDWTNESIMTNYFGLYQYLKNSDLYLEELNQSLDCVNLSYYSVLIIIDPEKGLTNSEISRLKYEFEQNHLSIFLISDWNEPFLSYNINYKDIETLTVSHPLSCGSEIQSYNEFLGNYGIQIGQDSISREFNMNNRILNIKSASSISKFPVNSYLFGNYLKNDLVLLNNRLEHKLYRGILGVTDKLIDRPNSGRLSVFTDSYCIDDYQLRNNEENCFWLISSIIKYLIHGNYATNELQLKYNEILKFDFDDEKLRKNYTTMNNYYIITNEHHNEKNLNICPKNNINFTQKFLNETDILPFSNIPYVYQKTSQITNTLPNIISKYSFDKQRSPNEGEADPIAEMIEDFLYVLVPIIGIIFCIFLLILCKKNRIKRTRLVVNLSYLKQTTSLESNRLNESTESSSIIINSLV